MKVANIISFFILTYQVLCVAGTLHGSSLSVHSEIAAPNGQIEPYQASLEDDQDAESDHTVRDDDVANKGSNGVGDLSVDSLDDDQDAESDHTVRDDDVANEGGDGVGDLSDDDDQEEFKFADFGNGMKGEGDDDNVADDDRKGDMPERVGTGNIGTAYGPGNIRSSRNGDVLRSKSKPDDAFITDM